MLIFRQVSSWYSIALKGKNKKHIFWYEVMSMMTSLVLKFLDSWKTQKSKYFESKIQFFLQIKHFIHWTLKTIIWQKIIFSGGVKKRIEFFHGHSISTFIVHFIKSLPYKNAYTTSWIYYNIYDIYNISPFLIRSSKN